MGSIHCPGGHIFSDGEVPSPYLYHLISDEQVEGLVAAITDAIRDGEDVEARIGYLITTRGIDTYRCESCGRLLLFSRPPGLGESDLPESGDQKVHRD